MQAQKWLEKRYSDKENTTTIGLDYNNESINGELIIENFPNLKEIILKNSYGGRERSESLSKLEIINCPQLFRLACTHHNLNVLNIRETENLQEIHCGDNKIVSLNLNDVPKLKKLYCQNNQLVELDLTNNFQLTHLDCQINSLLELDLTNNKELEYLCCNVNKLTKINLTKNTKLTKSLCCDNSFKILDLANNLNLIWFEYFPNPLKLLKISKRITKFGSYPMLFLTEQGNEVFRSTVKEIWDGLVKKLNEKYCEMELIDVSDLTNLTKQLNLTSFENLELLSKFVPREGAPKLGKNVYRLSLRVILDNLSNQLLARCLTVRSRLCFGKDEEYEKRLWNLALDWQKCGQMGSRYALRDWEVETLVSRVILGEKKLVSRITDLDYIKPEYKFKSN